MNPIVSGFVKDVTFFCENYDKKPINIKDGHIDQGQSWIDRKNRRASVSVQSNNIQKLDEVFQSTLESIQQQKEQSEQLDKLKATIENLKAASATLNPSSPTYDASKGIDDVIGEISQKIAPFAQQDQFRQAALARRASIAKRGSVSEEDIKSLGVKFEALLNKIISENTRIGIIEMNVKMAYKTLEKIIVVIGKSPEQERKGLGELYNKEKIEESRSKAEGQLVAHLLERVNKNYDSLEKHLEHVKATNEKDITPHDFKHIQDLQEQIKDLIEQLPEKTKQQHLPKYEQTVKANEAIITRIIQNLEKKLTFLNKRVEELSKEASDSETEHTLDTIIVLLNKRNEIESEFSNVIEHLPEGRTKDKYIAARAKFREFDFTPLEQIMTIEFGGRIQKYNDERNKLWREIDKIHDEKDFSKIPKLQAALVQLENQISKEISNLPHGRFRDEFIETNELKRKEITTLKFNELTDRVLAQIQPKVEELYKQIDALFSAFEDWKQKQQFENLNMDEMTKVQKEIFDNYYNLFKQMHFQIKALINKLPDCDAKVREIRARENKYGEGSDRLLFLQGKINEKERDAEINKQIQSFQQRKKDIVDGLLKIDLLDSRFDDNFKQLMDLYDNINHAIDVYNGFAQRLSNKHNLIPEVNKEEIEKLFPPRRRVELRSLMMMYELRFDITDSIANYTANIPLLIEFQKRSDKIRDLINELAEGDDKAKLQKYYEKQTSEMLAGLRIAFHDQIRSNIDIKKGTLEKTVKRINVTIRHIKNRSGELVGDVGTFMSKVQGGTPKKMELNLREQWNACLEMQEDLHCLLKNVSEDERKQFSEVLDKLDDNMHETHEKLKSLKEIDESNEDAMELKKFMEQNLQKIRKVITLNNEAGQLLLSCKEQIEKSKEYPRGLRKKIENVFVGIFLNEMLCKKYLSKIKSKLAVAKEVSDIRGLLQTSEKVLHDLASSLKITPEDIARLKQEAESFEKSLELLDQEIEYFKRELDKAVQSLKQYMLEGPKSSAGSSAGSDAGPSRSQPGTARSQPGLSRELSLGGLAKKELHVTEEAPQATTAASNTASPKNQEAQPVQGQPVQGQPAQGQPAQGRRSSDIKQTDITDTTSP